MTTFRADLDQMLDLASRMSVVKGALQHEGHGGFDCGALGDPDAVGAMQGFVSGWSHGRSEIISGLDTVHSALKGASDTYRGSDQGMAAKLKPS
ncbi:MAG TPA: hypothetical protein VFN68_09480 [Acidimicrobiales bacterium]|nr:hypothetical protein [Acidimicrobiales bacterium]